MIGIQRLKVISDLQQADRGKLTFSQIETDRNHPARSEQ